MMMTRWMSISMICLSALCGCTSPQKHVHHTTTSSSPYIEPEAHAQRRETPSSKPVEPDMETSSTAEADDRTPPLISEDDYLEVELWRAAYDGTGEDFLKPYCEWMVDHKHLEHGVLGQSYSEAEDTPLPRKDYIAYCKAHAKPTKKPFTSPTSPNKVSSTSFITTELEATTQYIRCESLIHEKILAYMRPDHTGGPIPSTKGFPGALAESQKLEARCRDDEKAFLADVLDSKQAVERVLAEQRHGEVIYTHLKPVDVMTLNRAISKHLIDTSEEWMRDYTCEELLKEARNDEFINCTEEARPHFTVEQPSMQTMQNLYNAYGNLSGFLGGGIWITEHDDMIAVLAVESSSPGSRGNNHDWYNVCDDCEGSSSSIVLYNARGELIMAFTQSSYA